jgi:DinB superfamily
MNNIIVNQIEAALATLNQAIENCPDSEWNEKHGDDPFCQVVFHTLFYTDVYLGRDDFPLQNQQFHKENKSFFMDYEEWEDRIPVNLYDKAKCKEYMSFCLKKCREVVSGETYESMLGDCGIARRKMSRLELYIYLVRHIQHHAAQLGLRIQARVGKELSWVGSGWK